MAKVSGVATQLSGKVGQLIYRQTKYGTVVYEAPAKASVPQRTEAQMQIRTQWGNMAAVYRQFNQTLKKGFEGLNGRMNDYNAFIQANTNVVKVYVPRSVRLNGGSVLAPYQITRGTLPSVAMVKNGSNVLVSDILIGSLSIGEETTVADLANAVMALNDGWQAGDQLTFFYGQQTVDAVTGIPRARIYGYKVMLNPGDMTPLLEVVSVLGFTAVDGRLGMNQVITDGAAVWVHSREDGVGGLKVSTQFLYVDSSVLGQYQTESAMAGAASSYGGINTSAVYLNPKSTGNVTGVVTPATPGSGTTGNGTTGNGNSGGNGGSGTSQGGSSTGGQSSSSGGGDEETGGGSSGGSTGGSETGGNTTGNETGGSESGGSGGNETGGGDSGDGYYFG